MPTNEETSETLRTVKKLPRYKSDYDLIEVANAFPTVFPTVPPKLQIIDDNDDEIYNAGEISEKSMSFVYFEECNEPISVSRIEETTKLETIQGYKMNEHNILFDSCTSNETYQKYNMFIDPTPVIAYKEPEEPVKEVVDLNKYNPITSYNIVQLARLMRLKNVKYH
jgi:hypothetical protein